jgi:tRNA 2-selenouridine synthase
MEFEQINDYRALFLADTPLIDVRAPVEYTQGAFPAAVNLPLLSNDERHQVGIRYKEKGQQAAISLGHELVSDKIKDERISHWQAFVNNNPHGALYCFRGGLRSKISQQWIYEHTGINYPRVEGGYKALRRFLLEQLEIITAEINPIILGGRTGTGKTLLLQTVINQIDLEGIFHHRGSAFGKHATAQPSQIDIENKLSIALLKHKAQNNMSLLLEDEAQSIGSRRVPDCIAERIKTSPLVLLEVEIEDRVNNIYDEYINKSLGEYIYHYGEDGGLSRWSENLRTSLDNIQRRLGGVRHKSIKSILDDALHKHMNGISTYFHKDWIHALLVDYYDPMYDYQIDKKRERIIYRGNHDAILQYIDKVYDIR